MLILQRYFADFEESGLGPYFFMENVFSHVSYSFHSYEKKQGYQINFSSSVQDCANCVRNSCKYSTYNVGKSPTQFLESNNIKRSQPHTGNKYKLFT